MKRVLLTHADTVLGRRMTKALCRDPDVEVVFAVGDGPEPSWFGAYHARARYQPVDLARTRETTQLVQSDRWARAAVDSVIHLPFADERSDGLIPGRVASLVSETRRLLAVCRESARIERFVYLSSSFVYEPEPANGAVVSEDHPLGFATADDPRIHAWIDADQACTQELESERLCMTVLRAPCVAMTSGEFINAEPLYGVVPAGYDPLVSVISERDAARAVLLALHADKRGVYNVAGNEVFARSSLLPSGGQVGPVYLPGALRGAIALVETWVGRRHPSLFHRYGIVLSTRRACESLGYRPHERLELRSRGSGPARLDAQPSS